MRARAAVARVHRARVAVVARHGGMRTRAVVAGIDRAGVGVVALRVRGAHQRGRSEGVEVAGEVPKKVQDGGQAGKPPALLMLTPSKPARSGLGRVAGTGKKTRAGPRE